MLDLAAAQMLHDPAIAETTKLPRSYARAHASRQRRLRRSVAEAAADGDLLLRYQPRRTLDAGRQTAAEAVVRWRDRPAAEHVEVGSWMLRAATAAAASWPSGCVVSVAVSARQLAEGLLPRQLATALDASGLNPELLEVSLTEAALIDFSVDTLLLLSAVRDLGAGVALDRFGIGLASLAVLHRLPLTAIKLDPSLLRGLSGEGHGAALVRTVIAAGHALDLTVVADGVATAEQAALLHAHGCDEGQGAWFGPPLSGDMRAR